jgi:hypothetical protein
MAGFQIAINHLFDIGPPEALPTWKMLIIEDPDKGFKIVLYTAVAILRLRIWWTIDSGRSVHDVSPLKKSNHPTIPGWRK